MIIIAQIYSTHNHNHIKVLLHCILNENGLKIVTDWTRNDSSVIMLAFLKQYDLEYELISSLFYFLSYNNLSIAEITLNKMSNPVLI